MPDEEAEFGLQDQRKLCEAYGLAFVSFPIPDRGVPASQQATTALVRELDHHLADGKKIAVHCRQGVGRSSLIAACLLVASGAEPNAAFDLISAARGCAVPETLDQERWVRAWAAELAPHPAR